VIVHNWDSGDIPAAGGLAGAIKAECGGRNGGCGSRSNQILTFFFYFSWIPGLAESRFWFEFLGLLVFCAASCVAGRNIMGWGKYGDRGGGSGRWWGAILGDFVMMGRGGWIAWGGEGKT